MDKKFFSILMPPPNVTGSLHMGHALTYTVQDSLIRYARLCGMKTRWQAGFDHAGIATQMLAEKELARQGKSKNDMTREEFLNFINERKNTSMENIKNQVNSLGMNVDWSNARFTLDEKASQAVIRAFVSLYNDGLIYREKKLVHWDTVLQTTVSDLEVVNKEVKGKLYYVKYFLVNDDSGDNGDKSDAALNVKSGAGAESIFSEEFIEIATTRPETILGDSAIAVNSKDERYSSLIGRKVFVPMVNRTIEIIADDYVEMDFGTGALKVTPAHDFNDFEIGKKHNLEFIEILNKKGEICDTHTELDGLPAKAAREKMVKMLSDESLLIKEENIVHSVPHCDRSGAAVEPRITLQWFFNVDSLAKKAKNVVENGKIVFFPNHWYSTYMHWLSNIQQWCISRQLIWGHQIPAWYDENGNVFVAESKEEACKIAKTENLVRDEDVLDTWFSSALWPFSALGWPEEGDLSDSMREDLHEDFVRTNVSSPDYLQTESLLKNFYPSSVLVTGFDIIFFWVARMIMMGLNFMNKVPFEKVLILPIICDSNGQKMSKTKGNSIDPLEIAQKYSSDSLRLTLVKEISSKRNIRFVENKVEMSRNFITKARNAFSYVENCVGSCAESGFGSCAEGLEYGVKNALDLVKSLVKNSQIKSAISSIFVENSSESSTTKSRSESNAAINSNGNLENKNIKDAYDDDGNFLHYWILNKLYETINCYTEDMNELSISNALSVVMDFTKNDFCDWYIEFSKNMLNPGHNVNPENKVSPGSSENNKTQYVLSVVIVAIMYMLYPFAPTFVSEILGLRSDGDIQIDVDSELKYKLNAELNVYDVISEATLFTKEGSVTNQIRLSEVVIDMISEIRSIKGLFDMNSQTISVKFLSQNEELNDFINSKGVTCQVEKLAKVNAVSGVNFVSFDKSEKSENSEHTVGSVSSVIKNTEFSTNNYEAYVNLSSITTFFGIVEVYYDSSVITANSMMNLEKKMDKIRGDIQVLSNKLDNDKFVRNADVSLVKECESLRKNAEENYEKMSRVRNLLK